MLKLDSFRDLELIFTVRALAERQSYKLSGSFIIMLTFKNEAQLNLTAE